jgi:hypothetical protein
MGHGKWEWRKYEGSLERKFHGQSNLVAGWVLGKKWASKIVLWEGGWGILGWLCLIVIFLSCLLCFRKVFSITLITDSKYLIESIALGYRCFGKINNRTKICVRLKIQKIGMQVWDAGIHHIWGQSRQKMIETPPISISYVQWQHFVILALPEAMGRRIKVCPGKNWRPCLKNN